MKSERIMVRTAPEWKKRVVDCAAKHGLEVSDLMRMATESAVVRMERGDGVDFEGFAGWVKSVKPGGE